MMGLLPPSADAASTFGELLRGSRVAAGLTQEALASRSGLSLRGISDLECGRRLWPRKATVRLLVAGLGLTGDDRTAFVRAAQRPPTPKRLGSTPASGGRSAPHLAPALGTTALPFVGRTEELALVARLLADPSTRLVTLTGVGGCGKTRLALEVAKRVDAVFPDGVAFVDLAPVTDPTLVLGTIASSLDLRAPDGQPIDRALIAWLHDQRMLLLLDNCEQLLPVGPEIAHVLVACPNLTMLATSRERLNLRAEQEVLVWPLPLPDQAAEVHPATLATNPAVALFLHRASRSHLDFALTADNAAAIASICRLLDGLPLAIELAAARITSLAPQDLADRLEQRLPLLTGGARDAPARQRTLRDALAWSYDLLSADEQALFRRLAIFVGGWTLAAAEAVVGPVGELTVLDGLGSLIDKNLLRLDQRGTTLRYSMFETVREFALERLDQASERAATGERHAAYFLALAERGVAEMDRFNQRQWLEHMEAEHPNVRQAFITLDALGDDARFARLAIALKSFWFSRSLAGEGLARLGHVLARQPGQNLARARALNAAGTLAYACGEYEHSERWLQEGEALARALGEQALLADDLLAQGAVAEHRGDEAKVQHLFEAGLAVAHTLGDVGLIGELLTNLSDAAYRRGDLALAEQCALEAVPALHGFGDACMASVNSGNLAQVALARGTIDRAAAAFQEGLRLAEEIGNRWCVADAIAGSGAIGAALGRYDLAARLLGAADAERERAGPPQLAHFSLFDQTQQAVRRVLGLPSFQASWDTGQALTEEEAIAEARAIFVQAGAMETPAGEPSRRDAHSD